MDAKQAAAEKAVAYLKDGMVVGLGTGSTTYWAIQAIGREVNAGLRIRAVASSIQTERMAASLQIPVVPFAGIRSIDVTIDGADEVDAQHHLIKGGGGALLREKILAFNSKSFLVIVDDAKLVDRLGKFPLPVEVVPFAAELTLQHLQALGCQPKIRKVQEQPFLTDNHNLIADCQFTAIGDPARLDQEIRRIPGVVETGLFLNSMVSTVVAGYPDGSTKEMTHQKTNSTYPS